VKGRLLSEQHLAEVHVQADRRRRGAEVEIRRLSQFDPLAIVTGIVIATLVGLMTWLPIGFNGWCLLL
jgi:hypothetical protein